MIGSAWRRNRSARGRLRPSGETGMASPGEYSMIGALAEVAGLDGNIPDLALHYLQDYELLLRAVRRWPAESAACRREHA